MSDFSRVFAELKAIMQPYADRLDMKIDSDSELSVDTRHILKNKKPLFFGAVQVKKNYVSYHLMPVYFAPGLLEGISPELKKRMQGKSCFNFREVDQGLFRELAALTKAAYAECQDQGFA